MANICYFDGKIVSKDRSVIEMIGKILRGDDMFRHFHRIYDADMYEIEEVDGFFIGHFYGDCAWAADHMHTGENDREYVYHYYRDGTYDEFHGTRMECVSLKGLQEIFDFGYYLFYEEEGNACVWDCARDNHGNELFDNFLYNQKPADWYTNPETCDISFKYTTTPHELRDLYKEDGELRYVVWDNFEDVLLFKTDSIKNLIAKMRDIDPEVCTCIIEEASINLSVSSFDLADKASKNGSDWLMREVESMVSVMLNEIFDEDNNYYINDYTIWRED